MVACTDASPRVQGRAGSPDRSVIERYRTLVSVNAALAKALFAIRPHLAHSDDTRLELRERSGQGLPRWQVRRARDFLAANLATSISTADVAAACGLSRSYFISAFRRATGETPHLCLLRCRVEKAKELLRGPLAIADIALACGFADQSHLTRVFAKQTGISPGIWRRERGCWQQPGANATAATGPSTTFMTR
ncbi:MAG: helix-turn-helix domain-containing protein [Steroidobacteraceae bacterium]